MYLLTTETAKAMPRRVPNMAYMSEPTAFWYHLISLRVGSKSGSALHSLLWVACILDISITSLVKIYFLILIVSSRGNVTCNRTVDVENGK